MAVTPAPSRPPKEVDMHVVVTFVQWYLLVGFALGFMLAVVASDDDSSQEKLSDRVWLVLYITFAWFPFLVRRFSRPNS